MLFVLFPKRQMEKRGEGGISDTLSWCQKGLAVTGWWRRGLSDTGASPAGRKALTGTLRLVSYAGSYRSTGWDLQLMLRREREEKMSLMK